MDDDDDQVDKIREVWRFAQRKKRMLRLKSALINGNIRNVTEGPIVGQLLYVFRQLHALKLGEKE